MPEHDQIIAKAKHYCAYQERCISDVRKKLVHWKASKQQAEKVIEELADEKYLDEERFATLFASGKCRNNQWGKLKIEMELKKRGIPEGIVSKAISSIDSEEYTGILRNLLRRKSGEYSDGNPFEKKQKLIKYALGKGFRSDEIYRALGKTDI
jgi:regulatory protein